MRPGVAQLLDVRNQRSELPITAGMSDSIVAKFIAIIEAPLIEGEAAHAGFERKEAELRAAFATLDVRESRALHARLCTPRAHDRLAVAFSHLTVAGRVRLIHVLAGARRRAARRGH